MTKMRSRTHSFALSAPRSSSSKRSAFFTESIHSSISRPGSLYAPRMLSRSSGTVTKSEGTRFLVMISFMTATARCVFPTPTGPQKYRPRPLPRLAVLLLKGGRELVPLGLELASAVGADLIVEPQYLGPGIALTPSPRRATHSPPGVWQQTVYPVHHSPPLRLHVSSRRLPSRPRSARRA